jgi:RNA polymerase sigma-32 factor
MATEKITDLTYNLLSGMPPRPYHIKDIWAVLAQEYPDRFGITDRRKTPHDTLRVMMMREGDRFVRVGPNRYFIVTKAMTIRPTEEQRREKAEETFTDSDFYGAGLDRVVLAYQKTRDPRLAERILEGVRGLAVKEAREYVDYNLPEEDLVQEALIGVLRAIETFDPKKGMGGAVTHIANYIRGYIKRYYQNHFSLIRSTKNTPEQKMLYRRREFIEYKTSRDGDEREAILTSLIEKTRLTEEQVLLAGEHVTFTFIPIGAQFYHRNNEDGLTLEDILSSDDPTVEEVYETMDYNSRVREVINAIKERLNERELYIFEKRIISDEPLTLEELGQDFGLTRERVRQIETKVWEKIRRGFSAWV